MTIDSKCYSSSEKMVILSEYNLQEVSQYKIRFVTELSWDELCATLILIGCLRILFKVGQKAQCWSGWGDPRTECNRLSTIRSLSLLHGGSSSS